jgi:hypothetical protein
MVHKVWDGPLPVTQEGPYVVGCACRFRVYREPDMARVIAVATGPPDDRGWGRLVHPSAGGHVVAVWRRFQPTVPDPPILVEHAAHASSPPGGTGEDRFGLVEVQLAGHPELDVLERVGAQDARLIYSAPCRPVSASLVERLVGEPIRELGPGAVPGSGRGN